MQLSTIRQFALVATVGVILTNAVSAGEVPSRNFPACDGPTAVPDAATAIRLVGQHQIEAINKDRRLSPALQATVLQSLGPEERWQRTWRVRLGGASGAVPLSEWDDPDVKGGIWHIEMFAEGSAGGLIGFIARCSGRTFPFGIVDPVGPPPQ